jgi:uncharacterized protein (TIGR00288 family)
MPDAPIRLAVLIDADNTSAKFVKEMFDELAGYGAITVKRAYGDWSSDGLKGWRDVLLGNAISPQQQFAYTSGKNATDSALIIDAMDLLYSGNVDGFALVSSDSDFTPLAMRLRESGKRVIGVGRRKTPKAFVEACERFLFLEVLSEATGTPEQGDENPPRPIQSVLTKALNKIASDDENWTSLSELGNHLNRTDPSFDSRNYGFSKLSDLVTHQPFVETKTVKNASGRGSLWVRLRGRRPAGAELARPATPPATKKTTAKRTTTKKATTAATKKSATKPQN